MPPSRTSTEVCLYAGPMRFPGGGECVGLRGSHRCQLVTEGTCVCICVALPPLLWTRLVEWADQAVIRERWGVWGYGRREELRDLVPDIYRLPGMSHCFVLSVLIPACMPTYCPTTQHTSRCWPRVNLVARVDCGQGVTGSTPAHS